MITQCAHAVHMLFTCCTHAVHMLFTCCSHAVHMLFTCCSHAVHMLFTCCTHDDIKILFPPRYVLLAHAALSWDRWCSIGG